MVTMDQGVHGRRDRRAPGSRADGRPNAWMTARLAKTSTRRRARAEVAHYCASARCLLETARYADAIGPLLEAARLAPDDAAVLNDLGVAYMATLTALPRPSPGCGDRLSSQPNVGRSTLQLGPRAAAHCLGDDEGAHRRASPCRCTLSRGSAAVLGAARLTCCGRRACGAEAIAAYERAYASAPTTILGRISARPRR